MISHASGRISAASSSRMNTGQPRRGFSASSAAAQMMNIRYGMSM